MALFSTNVPVDTTVGSLARVAANGLADFAVRSLGGGPTAEPLGEPAPAVDPLLDLRLPDALRAWLKPAADVLGLTIDDGVVRDKYSRQARQVTYLSNGEIRRTLLHIDPNVLNDESAFPHLGIVVWAMEKDDFVVVFARDVMAPVSINKNVILGAWRERLKDCRFIAWPYVKELPTLDLFDQVQFMCREMGLEMLESRTQSAGAGELTVKDIDRIVATLSGFGEFNDSRGRKTLLMQAGLIAFASTVNLEGAPKTVGVDLVWQLTQHQGRVPPDNHTALGALLRTAMAIPEIPPSDANWLKALITRCAL